MIVYDFIVKSKVSDLVFGKSLVDLCLLVNLAKLPELCDMCAWLVSPSV